MKFSRAEWIGKHKAIWISQENYIRLGKYGQAAQSMDDALNNLFAELDECQRQLEI